MYGSRYGPVAVSWEHDHEPLVPQKAENLTSWTYMLLLASQEKNLSHSVSPITRNSTQAVRSRVSSGSIVSDYGLDDRAIGVRSPAEAKDFSSDLCVQTGSGAHPASCTMGTGGPFPGGKAAGA
jgi:hypothetical protein